MLNRTLSHYRCLRDSVLSALGALILLSGPNAQGDPTPASLIVYSNALVSGFQSWGAATVNFTNTAPVHGGNRSISVTCTSGSASLSLHNPAGFDSSPYTNVSYWLNGGSVGGQTLKVTCRLTTGGSLPTYILPAPLVANTWQQILIPLAALGVANTKTLTGFTLQSTSGAQATFYVGEITLVPPPAPTLVHLTADAATPVRTVDARLFGMNSGPFDPVLDSTTTTNELKRMGCLTLRFGGGDDYHWATGTSDTNTGVWSTSCGNFYHVATNLGLQAIITVNYGSGTANEAAGWVRSANVTNHCGIKYWEVGNECFGSWEIDSNIPPHDPYTYAVRAQSYFSAMKAADPSIKIGVPALAGEDEYANNTNHPATNPRTGKTHNGWTPVMLATLHSLGVTPDFLSYHYYPEGTMAECDPILLQTARNNWTNDAASLRQQITDYLGAPGSNTELLCTENNSESGSSGKQECSLVNGLYLADSLASLMQTEFKACCWCGLQFSSVKTPGSGGSFDPSLYGWRLYGTQGVMNETTCPTYPAFLTNCYPPYHAFNLMHYFAQPGDTIVKTTSDYLLLSAYAARRTNGTLALLVINKDAACTFSAQIALTNFVPRPTATVCSYGIPQDEAARTNATPAAQGVAGPTDYPGVSALFTNSFPPYSLTLLTFAPAMNPPPLGATLAASGGQLCLSWPGWATNFSIYAATNLALPHWQPVTNPPQSSNELFYLSLPVGNGPQQFLRLTVPN